MSARLIDSAPPRSGELSAAPSIARARPASKDAGQRSRAIIPGDDPGDQQPPISTPLPVIHVDIDRSKANELGISMRSINDTLALLIGEHYVNSAAGQPVPLSNLVTLKTATEPNAV
jgi:multidrug efflux pump subunit AcrB